MKIEKKLLGLGLVIATVYACTMCTSSASMLVNCNFVRPDYGGSVPATGQYGVLGTSSDAWSNFPVGGSTIPLQDSTGGVTGLYLDQANFAGSWYNSGSFGSPNAIMQVFNESHVNDGTATVTISGFSGGTYDLYLYSAFEFGTFATTFTIGGTSKIASNDPFNVTSFVEGQNYVVFENIAPVNGNIVIKVDGATIEGTTIGTINAFQLVQQQVPEPITMGLLGAGIVGVILKRKRC